MRTGVPIVVMALAAGTLVAAQERYPIFTGDQLASTMETLGPNVAAVRSALDGGDVESAKAQLLRSREQLATTITFWRDHARDDAIGFVRDTVSRMDALDDALSADPVELPVAGGLAAEIDSACQACHAVYREQDPATREYRLKTEAF